MEKTEKPAPPAPPNPLAGAVLIPVASITLIHGRTMDLPGKPAATSAVSSPPSLSAYIRIGYDPRIRHHRVEAFEPGREVPREPKLVRMIPESWCSWVPG